MSIADSDSISGLIYIGRTLEGRARLGHINRAINLKIKQMSDLAIYGEEDVWSSPLEFAFDHTRDRRWRLRRLRDRKVDDLQIVILRDDVREEDHAVVAARLDGSWLMLDNLNER